MPAHLAPLHSRWHACSLAKGHRLLSAGVSLERIEFKASRDNGNTPQMSPALETSDSQQRFGIQAQAGQNLRVEKGVNGSYTYDQFSPACTLENGKWCALRLFVGDTGSNRFKICLCKRDDPPVQRCYELATTP